MRVLNSCFRIGLPSQWALRDNLELVRAKNKLFECFCLKKYISRLRKAEGIQIAFAGVKFTIDI